MKRLFSLILALSLLCAAAVHAQHERVHSFMVGGGSASIYDTYLSPFAYTGTNFHAIRETQRELHNPLLHIDGLTLQTLLDVDASTVSNPAGNVDEYAAGVRMSVGWMWRLPWLRGSQQLADKLSVHVGPMVSGYVGGIYNERNSNNPAQLKADLMLDLSAMAQYRFRLLRRQFSLRYQLAIPFVGMAYSPNYGQSYYEEFTLGKSDHNVVFANFANMPSMRHLLTLDVPLRSASQTTLRVGYAGEFMQSTFNNLRYHSYTHSFMIGLTQKLNRL